MTNISFWRLIPLGRHTPSTTVPTIHGFELYNYLPTDATANAWSERNIRQNKGNEQTNTKEVFVAASTRQLHPFLNEKEGIFLLVRERKSPTVSYQSLYGLNSLTFQVPLSLPKSSVSVYVHGDTLFLTINGPTYFGANFAA